MKNLRRLICFLMPCVVLIGIISFSFTSSAASSTLSSGTVYYIKNQRTGKYMTVASGTSGANVYQADYTGNTQQQFKLVLAEGSGSSAYYNIIPMSNTSLRVEVVNASNSNGANIALYIQNLSYPQAQRFKFACNIKNNRYTYRIMPKLSTTRVIDIYNCGLTSGTNIELYTGKPTEHQQDWYLEAVNTMELAMSPFVRGYRQNSNNTCGPTSARIILSNLGVYKAEEEITAKALDLSGSDYNYTMVYALKDTINFYLSQAGKTTRYSYQNISSDSSDSFGLTVGFLAGLGYPTQVQFRTSTTTYLPYTTTGHYGVVSAYKADLSGNAAYLVLCDPFWTSIYANQPFGEAGQWDIPYGTLYGYIKNHSGYIILATIA